MEILETKIQMVIGHETLIVEKVLDKEEVDFLESVILLDINSGKCWNVNQGRGGFSRNSGFFSPFNGFSRVGGIGNIICQSCFKHNHSVADWRDRFNRNFVLNFPA